MTIALPTNVKLKLKNNFFLSILISQSYQQNISFYKKNNYLCNQALNDEEVHCRRSVGIRM